MNSKAQLAAKIGFGAAAVAVAFVATHEGTILRAYRDPIGIITACTGHVDANLRMGTTYTTAQCQEMLYVDLVKHADDLDCVRVPLTDGQKVALLSFTFNVGARNFCGSTLVKKANAGAQALEWCAELNRWTYAGGKQLPGLVKRREAEYGLCMS
ncbi:Lysozyme RrrD [Variovorax sp. PBS-H4]|uniref:lysozyme n=1 Tax=Variovorax sp. PBS-H4 TaxID=434008 RepID=UPI001319B642|nr:lysozyme [Variovorax sp. PBS-H4]VTU25394.1 Lysozyme RrrD [Variovorax sp. PBS-H4]